MWFPAFPKSSEQLHVSCMLYDAVIDSRSTWSHIGGHSTLRSGGWRESNMKYRVGDWVEVLSPEEILQTLDDKGA